MKIGLISQFGEKQYTGVSQVIHNLIMSLYEAGQPDEYYYIGEEKCMEPVLPCIPAMINTMDLTVLDFMESAYSVNVIHSFYWPFYVSNKYCGKIITVHDIIPIKYGSPSQAITQCFMEPMRQCIKTADIVTTVSENTKKDVINYYGITEEKVKVIYPGIPENILNNKVIMPNAPLEKNKYIFCVSALAKYKNQVGLIKAFSIFQEKYSDTELKLVLTGPYRANSDVDDFLSRHPEMKKNILFLGFVSDRELVWLYKNALLMAYPSIYEGFGIPVLEALYFGKAVICSNAASLPEVGGNAVEYCDPNDVDSIELALEHVIFDDSRRADMEKKAIAQAGKFSYQKAAIQYSQLYHSFQ